jgi:hypothetical protein
MQGCLIGGLKQDKWIILRNSSGNQKVPSNPLQSDKEREMRKNNKREDEKGQARDIILMGETHFVRFPDFTRSSF